MTATAPSRPRKGKKTRRRGGLATLFLLLLLAAAGAAGYLYWQVGRPYQGFQGEAVTFTVPSGAAASRVLDRLAADGVLADARTARLYLKYVLHDRAIQTGDYEFRGPATVAQVLHKITRGDVITRKVTLVEGMTLEETAEGLAGAGFGSRETFLDLMRNPERIADLDPAATDLEGYLLPDTYTFPQHVAPAEVVKTLVKAFRSRYEKDVRPILVAHSKPRSLREVVILASIVEKEAQKEAERPIIAAVYQNRADRHIGFAADPTVIYAMKKAGTWHGNIRRDDLAMDSPYNTYRYAGFPPGPICSPGIASLKAAAEPANVPYLYFVSRNDGSHVFAETLTEHNRNVETWQRRYWRDKRAEQRREPGR